MRISALMMSRYRAFKEEIRIDVKKLNIIIGRNGGGKSVITRLPLIISGGLSEDAEGLLDLTAGGVTHGTRYEDLVYQRSAQPFMLGAEISDGETVISFKTTLRHIVENYAFAVEAFEVTENGVLQAKIVAATPEDLTASKANFTLYIKDKEPRTVEVNFAGLLPRYVEGDADISRKIKEYRDFFENAFRSSGYLGPFRSEAASIARVPRQGVLTLGPKGERALDLLGDNVLRGDGVLAEQVKSWFEQAMYGNGIIIQMAGGIPRLLVHDAARGLEVDLAETGAGFAQVLPIVTQLLAIDAGILKNGVSIVEQPELHLHPAAHGAVADLFIQLLQNKSPAVQICETHSEQFITRVRLRIAEQKVDPRDINLISVGHQSAQDEEVEPIRQISFDEYGSPDSWPVGVFNEAFDDLVLLKAAGAALDRQKEAERGEGAN